jgi:glyceraldehyde 3-phosphate dehydrogenase
MPTSSTNLHFGINGFGRTGRLTARNNASTSNELILTHINDPFMTIHQMKYLLEFDSIHGRFKGSVQLAAVDGFLHINNQLVRCTHEKEPSKVDWSSSNTSIVIESSGKFLSLIACQGHLDAGATKVIIAAPSPDAPLFVCGVNLDQYHPSMSIISNSSCNTNCLALVAKVLEDEFGIQEGLMTAIHCMTGTQNIIDGVGGKDWRRSRAAAHNIVPTTTGAAKSVGKVSYHTHILGHSLSSWQIDWIGRSGPNDQYMFS